MTSKRKTTAFHFMLCVFSNQSTSSTIFKQISPNMPKFPLTCPKIFEERLQFYFGCHFCKIKAHTVILRKCFHTFCPNFRRFCPDFHQIKSFRGVLSHPATSPPTPVMYFPDGCEKLHRIKLQRLNAVTNQNFENSPKQN